MCLQDSITYLHIMAYLRKKVKKNYLGPRQTHEAIIGQLKAKHQP